MTTKSDHIRDDIYEVVKSYNPEIIDVKEFIWKVEELVELIEETEKEWAEANEAEYEKYQIDQPTLKSLKTALDKPQG